ncbi:YlzJ-like family protein [Oceanobacillus senegalensis]|uniref:YlzJ-like family protein n=1 Tax=Oceanobacillus senegalensis TaxID=1936063 RepID=UPI000A30E597|nr:YlzJ-like family protein [Oceanobacillus senegalensis]
MILYTPLSENDIFPPTEDAFSSRQCISCDGKMMIADRNQDGTYQVVQLLSSNPEDFLDQRFLPGSILG